MSRKMTGLSEQNLVPANTSRPKTATTVAVAIMNKLVQNLHAKTKKKKKKKKK